MMRCSEKIMFMVMAAVFLGFSAVGFAAEKTPDPTPDLGDALSRVELLSGLTAGERALLEPAARLYSGKAREKVITQGSTMGRILIVLDGEADIRIDGKSLVTLSGQVLLGEIEFLDGKAATADVILLRDADCIVLDNAELNRVLEAHPRVGYVIYREMARIEAKRLRRNSTPK